MHALSRLKLNSGHGTNKQMSVRHIKYMHIHLEKDFKETESMDFVTHYLMLRMTIITLTYGATLNGRDVKVTGDK